MSLAWEAFGATDVGRMRSGNEDSYRLDAGRGIFLVADGMGGHAAGEVASDIAAKTVVERLTAAFAPGAPPAEVAAAVSGAVAEAHDRILQRCRTDPRTRGMGTTLTLCTVEPGGDCHVGHIGDSRLYRLRRGVLEQLTRDHTWVQREIDEGRLRPEAAAKHPLSHILTRVLTDDLAPELDQLRTRLEPGDLLLLATDGLYNMLDDEAIRALLSADAPLADRAAALIRGANRAGGADNITVVLVSLRKG